MSQIEDVVQLSLAEEALEVGEGAYQGKVERHFDVRGGGVEGSKGARFAVIVSLSGKRCVLRRRNNGTKLLMVLEEKDRPRERELAW